MTSYVPKYMSKATAKKRRCEVCAADISKVPRGKNLCFDHWSEWFRFEHAKRLVAGTVEGPE